MPVIKDPDEPVSTLHTSRLTLIPSFKHQKPQTTLSKLRCGGLQGTMRRLCSVNLSLADSARYSGPGHISLHIKM